MSEPRGDAAARSGAGTPREASTAPSGSVAPPPVPPVACRGRATTDDSERAGIEGKSDPSPSPTPSDDSYSRDAASDRKAMGADAVSDEQLAELAALQAQVAMLEDMLARRDDARRRQLSELADDNSILRNELARLRALHSGPAPSHGGEAAAIARAGPSRVHATEGSAGAGGGTGDVAPMARSAPAGGAVEMDGAVPSTVLSVIKRPHGRGNVISCRASPCGTWVATGGADHRVVLHSVQPLKLVAVLKLAAPLLSVEWHPAGAQASKGALLAASCMDAQHYLLHFQPGATGSDIGKLAVLQKLADHTKFVNRVRWSRTGATLASASHDHSTGLYRLEPAVGGATARLVLAKRVTFGGCVEAMCLTTGDGATRPVTTGAAGAGAGAGAGGESKASGVPNGETMIVCARDDPYFHFVDCGDFSTTRVPIVDGSTSAPSFTIMDLVPSPGQTFLAAATNGAVHFVYKLGTSEVVSRLVGHVGDRENFGGSPRLAWHPSGEYLAGNGGRGHEVLVWNMLTDDLVLRIPGHTAHVRDLCFFVGPRQPEAVASGDEAGSREPARGLQMCTASYDKSLRVWGCPARRRRPTGK